jgi:hypothetical protein
MARELPPRVTIKDLKKYRGTAVFSNNMEDHLSARLISLLDGDILPLPTLFDLERDKQRIAFAVCDTTGITREELAKMDMPSREVCLEKTISAELTKPTVTVWHHGERSYSAECCDPIVVSSGEAYVLAAFAEAQRALDTPSLEKKVPNVARVIGQIGARFPGVVRWPGKRGEGYFIRVLPASSR